MLCGPSCRVRRPARRRRPAVPLRCPAKVRPSAFLCRLSCSVDRYAPSAKSRFILRRVTVYHRRSYHHHSHRGGHSHRSQNRSTAACPDAEVGARSAVISRSAVPLPGSPSSAFILLPVRELCSSLCVRWLVACCPVLRMAAAQHSPWRQPTILTMLHTTMGFECGRPTHHDGCLTLGVWCAQRLAYAWRPAGVNVTASHCRPRPSRPRCAYKPI